MYIPGLHSYQNEVEFLIERKFRTYRNYIPIHLLKPNAEKQTALNQQEEIYRTANKYRAKLEKMPKAQLRKAYQTEYKCFVKELSQQKKQNRFFNVPESKAIFEYWTKSEYWTIDDAVALFLGRDPRCVNWSLLRPYLPIDSFANKYSETQELLYRAIEVGKLEERDSPEHFIGWASSKGSELPSALLEICKKSSKDSSEDPNKISGKHPSTRRELRKLETLDRHNAWRKEAKKLRKSNPKRKEVWIAQRIAKMAVANDCSNETIRKVIREEYEK